MKYWTLILLVSFIGMAFFGFSYVSHATGAMHSANTTEMNHSVHAATSEEHIPADCIISFLDAVLCPTQANTSMNALHHIGAYQSFSNTITAAAFSFSLLLVLFGIILSNYINVNRVGPVAFAYISRKDKASYTHTLSESPFTQWLSLLQNSPSF